MGVVVAGETAGITGESIGEAHQVLEHTQAHPPGNQHQGSKQKGRICLWEAEVTEQVRAKQAALFPLTPPPLRAPQRSKVLPRPGKFLRLFPLGKGVTGA